MPEIAVAGKIRIERNSPEAGDAQVADPPLKGEDSLGESKSGLIALQSRQ